MTTDFADSLSKRLIDVLLASILLVVLSPVFLVIMGMIFLIDGRPLFYFQRRAGRHKQPFTLIKFRTMIPGAEAHRAKLMNQNEAPAPMFKMKHDPRFTKLGKFLSITGLDELPQLLHVVQGTMSIVGPRPLPLLESEALPKSWNFRYEVKPGIVSEWALSGKKYASLDDWKTLEKETIEKDSVAYELHLILQVMTMILTLLLTESFELVKQSVRR